jgi:D-2-hydroxyacid dehydrogenase (NADP+)
MNQATKRLCILVATRQADRYADIIKERFPETRIIAVDILNETEENRISEDVEEVDVVVAASALPYSLPRIRKLKWFQAISAGYEHILKAGVITREMLFTNAAGVAAIPVSETVLGFMLCFVKRFPQMWERQKQKTLVRTPGETSELCGKIVGILGVGNLGRAVAKRAKLGFEMRVLGYDISAVQDPYVESSYEVGQLQAVLEESDFVVITLPLTPETDGLIGEELLRQMKKTAYLINVARGEIIVKDALIRGLRERWIAGAALDVYWGDPTVNLLAPDDEIWQLDNIILTPHNAGTSDRYLIRAFELFCTNLERFIRGKELINLVKDR